MSRACFPLRCCFAPAAAAVWLCLATHSFGQPAVIGTTHRVTDKETSHPYEVAPAPGTVTWSTEIVHKGAKFIKIKFETFSLGEGDYVIVRDPNANEVFRYGSNSPEEFWAYSVFAERVIVELYSTARVPGRGLRIAGYAQSSVTPNCGGGLCGVDAQCGPGAGGPPANVLPLRLPTCAIVVPDDVPNDPLDSGNLYFCSGYQIDHDPGPKGASGFVLTNKHCDPAGGSGWDPAEAWFNVECNMCGGGVLKLVTRYSVSELCFDGDKFLIASGLDYSLLRTTVIDGQTNPQPAGFWGKLPLRNMQPVPAEAVHRFHHSSGRQKQYTAGVVTCPAPNNPASYWDYTALGGSGSSGSPVIADFDKCVVLHHGYAGTQETSGCVPGKGSEMVDLIADMTTQDCLPPNVMLCNTQPVEEKGCCLPGGGCMASDCEGGGLNQDCLPMLVIATGLGGFEVVECGCATSGECGPVDISAGNEISCAGACSPSKLCEIFIDDGADGIPTGLTEAPGTNFAHGLRLFCDCAQPRFACFGPDPQGQHGECVDALTEAECLGSASCATANPDSPCVWFEGESCDEVIARGGLPSSPIPTVSAWGLVVLTLLLLAAAKSYFGRRKARGLRDGLGSSLV